MICLVEGNIEREERRPRTCLHDENSRTSGTQTFEEKRFPRFSFGVFGSFSSVLNYRLALNKMHQNAVVSLHFLLISQSKTDCV